MLGQEGPAPVTEPRDTAHPSTRSQRAMAKSQRHRSIWSRTLPREEPTQSHLGQASARKGSKHGLKGHIRAAQGGRLSQRHQHNPIIQWIGGKKNKVLAD